MENKVEKKIYSGYAFTENETAKGLMNREIYNELKGKAEVKYVKSGYATAYYEVVSNPEKLNTLQLALLCDDGNLCFGYRTEGKFIVIHTD